MTSDLSRPAGWYPDESMANTVRYWDGSTWTGQVAPATPASHTPGEPEDTPPGAAASDAAPAVDGVSRSVGLGCLSIVALAVVLFVIGAVNGDEEDDLNGSKYGAQGACEDFVEARLKAPATADFNHASETHLGDAVWRVSGTVDSENSFGAKVRTSFVCETEYDGDHKWTLVSLDAE